MFNRKIHWSSDSRSRKGRNCNITLNGKRPQGIIWQRALNMGQIVFIIKLWKLRESIAFFWNHTTHQKPVFSVTTAMLYESRRSGWTHASLWERFGVMESIVKLKSSSLVKVMMLFWKETSISVKSNSKEMVQAWASKSQRMDGHG